MTAVAAVPTRSVTPTTSTSSAVRTDPTATGPRSDAVDATSAVPPGAGSRPHAEVRVDTDAVRDNVAAVRAHLAAVHPAGAAPAVMAVVKADAYGHGLVPCARAALAGGATFLGTALFAESLALRAAGVGGRVVSWLVAPGFDYGPVLAADIEVVVCSTWQLAEVVAAAQAAGVPARVHLGMDTGLGRNGATAADQPALVDAAARAQAAGGVVVEGVMSHLACADRPADPATDDQVAAFARARALAAGSGLRPPLVHLANSAATFTRADTHGDLVRVGLACYGLSPIPELAGSADLGLRPAMRLSARLAGVKDVPAGQGVSYDLTYRTPGPTRLGLVPLGYADGIGRSASGVAPVLAGGAVHRIAGRVAMDQFVLDLGPGSDARPGDEVVLFGPGTEGEPTAQDWADACGTISYEITTRIPAHVPRVHVGTAHLPGPADLSRPADPSGTDSDRADPTGTGTDRG